MIVSNTFAKKVDEGLYCVQYFPLISRKPVLVKIPRQESMKYQEAVPKHNIRERHQRGIKFSKEWLNLFHYNLVDTDFGREILAEVVVQKKVVTVVKNGRRIVSEYVIVDVYKLCIKDAPKFKMSFPMENTVGNISCDSTIIDYCEIPGTHNFILFQYLRYKEVANF